MPKAALAKDLIADGNVRISEGERLTGLQAHKLWKQYRQGMKFRCLCCRLPLEAVNVHKEESKWKKIAHFRPTKNKKDEHNFPCEYAEESQRAATPTGEFEVAYHEMEIPTKLVKRPLKSSGATVTTSNRYGLGVENDGAPDIRHQALTCHMVEELCDVYFEKIKDCESPKNYASVLEEFPLILPGSNKDIGYAQAFWSVHSSPLPTDYRIFYGAVKEVVKCQDGYLISYSIPWKDINEWKPVVAYLPQNVLDEFTWGRHIEGLLSQDEINKTRSVFQCGRPRLDSQGIVIPLEHVYWIHCRKDSRWPSGRVLVSEELQPFQEVLPKLLARQRKKFQQKFPIAGRTHRGDVNNAEPHREQEPLIIQPDLPRPSPLTEIISLPLAPEELPEQNSTLPDRLTTSLPPEQESLNNGKPQSGVKRVIDGIRWVCKKLRIT